MIRPTRVLAGLAVAVTLAACGNGAATDDPDPSPDTPPPTTSTASPTPEPASGTSTSSDGETPADGADVEIVMFAFDPETISVPAGTTVVWTNGDATRHTVTAGSEDDPDADAFDLRVADRGDVVEFTFDEPGTYEYFCAFHPFMEGTVEVTG